jgi:hypothetical protein
MSTSGRRSRRQPRSQREIARRSRWNWRLTPRRYPSVEATCAHSTEQGAHAPKPLSASFASARPLSAVRPPYGSPPRRAVPAPVPARRALERHFRHERPAWLSQIASTKRAGKAHTGFEPVPRRERAASQGCVFDRRSRREGVPPGPGLPGWPRRRRYMHARTRSKGVVLVC